MKIVMLTIVLLGGPIAEAQWVETGLAGDVDVSSLVVQGNQIIAGLFGIGGNAGGVHISTDQGISWVEYNNGLENLNVLSLAVDGNEYLAGTWGGGVFYSSDNGSTWTVRNSGLTHLNINALLIDNETFFAGSGGGGVSVSTNQGLTWVPHNSGLTSNWIIGLYTNGNTLWAGAGSGGADRETNEAPELVNKDPFGGVFVSSDGGGTWDSRGLVDTLVIAFAEESPWLFVGGFLGGGLNRSTNEGLTWENFYVGAYDDVRSLIVFDGQLLAGTADGFFRSLDNGVTWEEMNNGLGSWDIRTMALSDSQLYVGTWNGGVWRRPLSDLVVSVQGPGDVAPSDFTLNQNYPNPFNPRTDIGFRIADYGFVSLRIYDLLGREVATLVNEKLAPGAYNRQWDATGYPSGVYFYRLATGNFVQTRKLLLLR